MPHPPDAPPERLALRWIGPACLTLLLMAYPWLAPGLQQWFIGGLPAVLLYLFGIWALAIALAAFSRAGT